MRRLPILLVASLAVVALLSAAQPAAATLIHFEDTFDSENGGVGVTNYFGFTNWDVTNGSVDLIGNGFFDFYPGNGLYIDLDGSTGVAGTMTTNFGFDPGSYVVTFQLGGNARGAADDTVFVSFGADVLTPIGITLASGDPLATYSFSFTSALGGKLSFDHAGTDNQGIILDNVVVDQVPEPGSLLLLGSGLVALGRWRRRRSA